MPTAFRSGEADIILPFPDVTGIHPKQSQRFVDTHARVNSDGMHGPLQEELEGGERNNPTLTSTPGPPPPIHGYPDRVQGR